MTDNKFSRRSFITAAGTLVATAATAKVSGASNGGNESSFSYCLNMGTIRGQDLSIVEEVETAAKAGYDSIEPWLGKVNEFVAGGGSLSELNKRIADAGLTVENAIAFSSWIVDDDTERAAGLEQARRDMDTLAKIGAKRMAAPPAGAQRGPSLDLQKAAERYRALCEIGDQMGVTPVLELWGFSANLHRLGQVVYVAVEAAHPGAALLLDVYHIYKGGSNFVGLKLLSTAATPVFHINDYPANPPRDEISDRDRVYPGDGVAPLPQILRDLAGAGGHTVLSLELFNPDYYKQDPLEVARTGLAKTKAAVKAAFA